MEQPKKPSGFPAREILIPALKVGALSGKPVFCINPVLCNWIVSSTLHFMRGSYQASDKRLITTLSHGFVCLWVAPNV